MKAITIALPNNMVEHKTLTPSDIRIFLIELLSYYEYDVKGKQAITLYSGKTTKYTLRLDEYLIKDIKEYAKELNITILMFTACLANMYSN